MIRYFEKLPPTLVAIEACGSSHHWARVLRSFGHEVRLIPPQYVKPYVKRGKNDAADAQASCEAVSRPSMRFVPVKSREQQAACMLMTFRERLVGVKSQLSNAFRSYAAEFGIVGPAGRQNVNALMQRVLEDETLPEMARNLFRSQAQEYAAVEARLEEIETKLMRWHRADELSRRIATIPGVGPVGATMLSMRAPPADTFRSGRQFAAWLGLTPKDHSTGGRARLGASPRRMIPLSGRRSSWARPPCCGTSERGGRRPRSGSPRCWSASRRSSWLSRWPTKSRASRGG
jgi:transposase